MRRKMMGSRSKRKPHILVMARLGPKKGWRCWARVHTEKQAEAKRIFPEVCGVKTKLVYLNPRGP
jgi:hypothetical protein